MKVYLVIVEQVYDSEAITTNYPKAFDSLDKAKAALKKFVEREYEEDEERGRIRGCLKRSFPQSACHLSMIGSAN